MLQPSEQAVEALSAIYEEEGYTLPPAPNRCFYKPYRPRMNQIQSECYDAIKTHLYNLLHGPRYSGKTIGAIDALVDHCRENFNARALIIVLTGRQGEEGGAWYKLNSFIKAEWEKGGDAVFTEPKTNKYKDVFIWISNKFGGWSRVVLLSMPFEGFVADRIKGMEPTFILVDEAQTLETDVYFKSIVQQLGRDPNVPHQPIVYCANPAGPSHWLYKRFFIMPVDQKTGAWNPHYFVQCVPLADNLHNVPRDYIDRLIDATKGDDTEYRRMVLGEWVDAPTGEALFRDDFKEPLHMRGNALRNQGLIPVTRVPIITGFDLGAAHSSIHFQQYLPTVKKKLWMIFDEFNCVDQYVPYYKLVPRLLERIEYWKTRAGFDFQCFHISDSSAFNQFRARDGSFDHRDVEELSGGKIRLLECPKGPGSVETRVRMTKEELQQEETLISATCIKTKEMFLKLEQEKDNPMKPKRSRFIHPFDSYSYPHLFYNVRGRVMLPQIGDVKTEFYTVGG